ncbi:hypothetical protein ACFL08_05095 [Patescibacteria group bacterium]
MSCLKSHHEDKRLVDGCQNIAVDCMTYWWGVAGCISCAVLLIVAFMMFS